MKVYCPECGTEMGKHGSAWSGRRKKQNWLCSKCGRTKLEGKYPVNTKEEK